MIITKVRINNMTCNACEKVVSKKLSAINGVQEVKVDVTGGAAVIGSSSQIGRETVEKVLQGTHYEVVSVE